MYDAVIQLVRETLQKSDQTGVFAPAAEVTQVAYAHVESVSRSEWAEGGNIGLNPEYRLRLPRSSYSGEQELIYGGTRYKVYRTFERKNEIELYVEKATGATDYGD